MSENRFFSLSPIGGEGWGEGAGRAVSLRGPECPSADLHRSQIIRTRAASARRPLTLTLFPDGGEGISTHALDASPRALGLSLVALLVWLLLPCSATASSADALKQYESGRYDAALKEYDRLRAQRPEDARLAFNAGAAAYQAKKFEDATRHFSGATGARDPLLAQSAFYNLGNAYFQAGDAATEPEQKQEAWQGAIGFYDTALKLRPEDVDAKHNRDFVQRKLEELKKQQEKSKDDKEQKNGDKQGDQKDDQKKQDKSDKDKKPDEQKKDQQKPDQKKPEDSKPDQQKQDQQKQADKGGDQKPPEPKKPQDQQGQQKQGQKGDQGEQQSGQAAALGKMTAAQAMQLLDSQRNDERPLIFLPTNAVQKANNRVFKNW